MTDRWVSGTKYWCEDCRKFITGNKVSRKHHEEGEAHKANRQKRLNAMHRKEEEDRRVQLDAQRELVRVLASGTYSDESGGATRPADPRNIAPTIGLVSNGTAVVEDTRSNYIPPSTTTLLPIEIQSDNPHGFEYFGDDMIDIQRKVHARRQLKEIEKLEHQYKNYPDYIAKLQDQKEQLLEIATGKKKPRKNQEETKGPNKKVMEKYDPSLIINDEESKPQDHATSANVKGTRIASLVSDEVGVAGQWEEVVDTDSYYSSYYRPSANTDPYAPPEPPPKPVVEEIILDDLKRKHESDDEDDDGIITKSGVEALGEEREKTIDRLKAEKLNRLAGASITQVAFKKRKTNNGGMRRTAPSTF